MVKDVIKVIAKEEVVTYNHDMTVVLSEVQEDEILTAFLNQETEEYFAKDSKGREVYVGQLNYLGRLYICQEFALIKED